MKTHRDYTQDLADIRSMMEQSSKFLSLSGWSGVMAGIYALAGAAYVYFGYGFNPDDVFYTHINMEEIIFTGLFVLVLSVGTAIELSRRRARKNSQNVWNKAAKQMVINLGIPLVSGGVFILLLLRHNLAGLICPSTLLFYGIALYNAGKFAFNDLKYFGLIHIVLGLLGAWFIRYGLIYWVVGFGLIHIIYGIYVYAKYER